MHIITTPPQTLLEFLLVNIPTSIVMFSLKPTKIFVGYEQSLRSSKWWRTQLSNIVSILENGHLNEVCMKVLVRSFFRILAKL